MSAENIKATKEEVNVDAQKRAFMKKFGKYAAVGVGMSVLMGPGVSTANAYDFPGKGHGVDGDPPTETGEYPGKGDGF